MKQAILWFFINSIVGTLVYLGVLYVTFPSDVARDRLVYEANKAGVRMQLEDVKPTWPAGIRFTGVDIYSFGEGSTTLKKKGKRDEGSEEKDAEPKVEPVGAPGDAPPAGADAAPESEEVPVLTVDSLSVTSLTSTLLSLGKKVEDIQVVAALYGGQLDGTFSMNEEQQQLRIDAQEIDLGRMLLKGESFDVKASGLLGLKTDLTLVKEKVRESSGTVAILLDQFVLYKGSKVKGADIPIDLPMTITGSSWEVKNGRIEVEELKAENPNLTVTITGSIMLNQSFMRSRANLKVALKFDGELKMLGAFMPESAKSPDGVAHYILSGPLNNLRSRPDRLAARRTDRAKGNFNSNLPSGFTPSPREELDRSSGLPRPPMPGNLPGMLGGEGMLQDGIARPPVLDDEERERLREERRKRAEERRKRREELRQRRLEMMNQGGDNGGFVPPMVDDNTFNNNAPDMPNEPGMGEEPPPPMELDE